MNTPYYYQQPTTTTVVTNEYNEKYWLFLFWLNKKRRKTVHCIDNNEWIYTNKIKALCFLFYKYRWFANGIWRRFPDIIGGSNSIVVVGAVLRWIPFFDDERWFEGPFRVFWAGWIDSLDRIISPDNEFAPSKFFRRTTRCCCWYRWVGGGGGGTKEILILFLN
jgi:hypothetical protein